MENSTILNIPEIEKIIGKKHNALLKTYGANIEQIAANDKLLVERIVAKISRILVCFKDKNIIDNISHEKDGTCRKIHLSKDGYDDAVAILTNGYRIILIANNPMAQTQCSGEKYDIHLNEECVRLKNFYGADKDSFDWCKFSEVLVDFTHETVYNRIKVAKQKINNVFKN